MRCHRTSAIAGISLVLSTATGASGAPLELIPNTVTAGDQYGSAASVSGTLVVVGSPGDDENGADAGAAFVLRRECSSWIVAGKLVPQEVSAGDGFGCAVAVRDDTLVVGAEGTAAGAGAAYVFRFDGNDWGFVQKLLPDPAVSAGNFGAAVAVAGDLIVVGAAGDDERVTDSGAAYVFRLEGKHWQREQKVFASDAAAFDYFGTSVAVEGNTVFVGSPYATPTSAHSGTVYHFLFDGLTWVEQQQLFASDGRDGDGFGTSLAWASDTLIVGAPLDDGTRTDSGSAYVFTWNGTTWAQSQKLLPPTEASFNQFGYSVCLSGATLLIGEPGDLYSSSTPGTAHLFRFNSPAWGWDRTLTAADGSARDGFGWSVGLSGGRAVVGAPGHDDAGDASGAAYVDYVGLVGLGDFDRDGDTDLIDFASFGSCITGPDSGGAILAECTGSDFDQDDDVDLRDVAAFQRAFTCGD